MALVCGYANLPLLPKLGHIGQERTPTKPRRVHNATKRLGPKTLAALVADYRAGFSTRALMTKYDIGKGTVLRILQNHGVSRRHQSLTDAEIAEAIRLYQQGLSLAKVGERLGREASLIHLTLKRAGVPRRDSQGRER